MIEIGLEMLNSQPRYACIRRVAGKSGSLPHIPDLRGQQCRVEWVCCGFLPPTLLGRVCHSPNSTPNKLPGPKGRGIRRFASHLPEVAKSEDRRKRRGIYPQ